MKDIPAEFYSSMLEKGDGPGPFGSKGMAQTSIVTVAPAIGNAVYDALGVRVQLFADHAGKNSPGDGEALKMRGKHIWYYPWPLEEG